LPTSEINITLKPYKQILDVRTEIPTREDYIMYLLNKFSKDTSNYIKFLDNIIKKQDDENKKIYKKFRIIVETIYYILLEHFLLRQKPIEKSDIIINLNKIIKHVKKNYSNDLGILKQTNDDDIEYFIEYSIQYFIKQISIKSKSEIIKSPKGFMKCLNII
jgi:hypothetical protein